MVGISSFLLTAVLLVGTPVKGQQQSKLTASYSKSARLALSAIESDTLAPQDENSENIEIATTQAIDIADEKAITREEKSLTETLRQVYQLKRHDNTVSRAYRILMEVESAQVASDNVVARKTKDFAVSQFADGQAAIMEGEEPCFKQLEQSLVQRSADVTACSQWIQKAKMSDKNFSRTGENDDRQSEF
jgi:hypothetical protein